MSRENQQNAGNEQRIESPWALPFEDVLDRLDTNPETGLKKKEANVRLKRFGPNKLEQRVQRSAWAILIDQFKNFIAALLAAAAVVSFLFNQWLDGSAILVALGINVLIGFFTELKATRSMQALKEMTKTRAKVMREQDVNEIISEKIVPGDIVLLESGDIVPADMRLIESNQMQVDESALTGESVPAGKSLEPVDKETPLADRKNMLFKGTALTNGSGRGVATATGMQTEIGRISEMAEEAESEETPLEKRLNKLGQRMVWIVLVVAAIIGLNGFIKGMELFIVFETAVALAVAAIPEGLPIVATIALARGMWRMAKRNALMNRLGAVETLGSTSVIFADKTGTLTENRMTLQRVGLPAGSGDSFTEMRIDNNDFLENEQKIDPENRPVLQLLLKVGVLCNNAELEEEEEDKTHIGDPVEVALLLAGKKAGLERTRLLEESPETREDAFDPEKGRMATWHQDEDGFFVAVKGSPESVLGMSSRVMGPEGRTELTDDLKDKWLEKNRKMAGDGLRILAAACKKEESDQADPYEGLTFLGLYGLLDPPREGIEKSIDKLHQAGINVVMITGDQPLTASSISESVHLTEDKDEEVIRGMELADPDELSEEQKKRILRTNTFARVSPAQKMDLVKLYQQGGRVIAMTGDGVNDAPALKKADIGVAMGRRGTQVAREAADMVLKDDAFDTIVAAVEQGRIIFSNIRKFIIYLLSGNFGGIIVVGIAILAGMPLPLLPLQILYLNMLADVFPALALGVGPGTGKVMNQEPRRPGEPIVRFSHWLLMVGYGMVIAGCVLIPFWMAMNVYQMEEMQAVTISFLTLSFARQWHIFNMRDFDSGMFLNEVTRNIYAWGSILLCSAFLFAAVYIPPLAGVLDMREPGVTGWYLIMGFSLVPVVLIQLFIFLWNKVAEKRHAPA
ncbi:MAG: cation-translocating P-type ATPase [Desulfovibrionales bacterium]